MSINFLIEHCIYFEIVNFSIIQNDRIIINKKTNKILIISRILPAFKFCITCFLFYRVKRQLASLNGA